MAAEPTDGCEDREQDKQETTAEANMSTLGVCVMTMSCVISN